MCETRIFMHTFNLNSISQMKRKIFSALLMGVFTLASMSMFVSCKDYDDDINDLDQKQQDLVSQLTALQSDVNAKYTDLSGQLATAADNATKALQGVENANALINEVKGTAAAAGEAAAAAQATADGAQDAAETAQKAAEAAQKRADEALEAAKKALEAAGADESGKQALEKIAALETRVASLEALKESIPTLIEEAQKATNEELDKLQAKVDKYQAFFDNLFAMLTSVELYGTYSGNGLLTGKGGIDMKLKLAMIHGNVGSDSKFGDNEALGVDGKTIYATATPQITFTKGTDVKVNEGVVVRVNPINADITGDNVAIKVINSVGQDMSAYLKVASVEPYNDIITRAGGSKSGLYKINFEWVDGVNMDAYKTAVKDPTDPAKDVMFAIAINNIDTVQADRYVASTFDLALGDEPYVAANKLSYKVNGKSVNDLRNRWDGTSYNGNEEQSLLTPNSSAANAKEYTWNATAIAGKKAPATAMTKDNRDIDNSTQEIRYRKGYLPVSVGVPFTVELEKFNDANTPDKIQYYYVTLDENFAGSSVPSELNAWKSYDIDGLYTMTDASKKLDITINSLEANAEVGDKIGFRVYAVNYDGTLVDPDGRAFYVAVGDESTVASVDLKVEAWKGNSATVNLPADFKPAACGKQVSDGISYTVFDKYNQKSTSDASIKYTLLDGDSKPVTNWKDAKKIKVELLNTVQDFLDGATFSFTIQAKDVVNGVSRVTNTLKVNVTKVMPTSDALDVTFKPGQLVNGVYTCYLDAPTWNTPDWTKAASQGEKNLWDAVTGIYKNVNYIFTIANAAQNPDDDNKYTAPLVVKATGAEEYIARVDKALINGTDKHATTLECNFPNISYRMYEGKVQKVSDFKVPVYDGISTVFACPIHQTTYSWLQKSYGTDDKGNPSNYKDINYIVYEADNAADFGTSDNIANYIKATNNVDKEWYTSVEKWGWKFYQTGSITAKLTSDESGKEDYFTVKVDPTSGEFTFSEVSGATNPTVDVPSTLTIYAKDAFDDNARVIATLPFTVKRR